MVLSADMLKYKSSKCEVGKTHIRLRYRGRAKRPFLMNTLLFSRMSTTLVITGYVL